MYAVSARNTARGYKQIVPDTGIDLKRKAGQIVSIVPDPRDAEIAKLKQEASEAIQRANAALARMRDIEDEFGVRRRAFRPLLATIERRICRAMRISRTELYSNRRHRYICFARQAVFYWACRLTLMSMPEIGRRIGGRDHTTILHGARVYPQKRAEMGRHLRPVR